MMKGKTKVTVVGAGGKMGTRVSSNLAKHLDTVEMMLCENSPKGIEGIIARGFDVVPIDTAVNWADITVLAIPDSLIKLVSKDVVKLMKSDTTLLILDPAAAVAKHLCLRDDCTFAVTHPCHPSYFHDQDTSEARKDYFGGIAAKQDIVMAKIQGSDENFAIARKISEIMFEPVVKSYIMDIRQIAFLEPTLVEVLGATCLYAMAQTIDEAERRGIDRNAAISFLTGHIMVLTANFLGIMKNAKVSDACNVAIGLGNKLVLKEDWKKIWDDDVLDKVIATMLNPSEPKI